MNTLVKNVRVIDTSANIDVVEDVLISAEKIIIAPTKLPEQCLILNGQKKNTCSRFSRFTCALS